MPVAKSAQSTPSCHNGRKPQQIGWLFLFIAIFLAYSNTFQATWHLDDYPNIVRAERLHIDNLHPRTLIRTFFSLPQDQTRLYRPLACLSFALNWYVGQDAVAGYHLINIGIHGLTAWILYLTIAALFQTPRLKETGGREARFVALLGALLWALNPVQTQAVTYIVQRMAAMAALFYTLGIFYYLKGRLTAVRHRRVMSLGGCLVCFACSLASKENALMLPASLLLAEIIFLQDLADRSTRKRLLGLSLAIAGGIFAIGLAIVLQRGSVGALLDGYSLRPFSLSERLLTQPRILLFYLSQLFYPAPQRLSIEHDITLSTGLLTPWTTLPAMGLVLILIILGLAQIRKRPMLAWGVLFFFLNHVIESSIFPLELIFEHRNYLPSLFLFVPVAVLLQKGLQHYRPRQHVVYGVLAVFIPLLLIGLGTATYLRNRVWISEQSLWRDAMHKAPGSARPYINLAWDLGYGYNEKQGRYEDAIALYQKSLPLHRQRNNAYTHTLTNIAGLFLKINAYDQALVFSQAALGIEPDLRAAQYYCMVAFSQTGRLDQAATYAAELLANNYNPTDCLRLLGLIRLKQGKAAEATDYLTQALKRDPHDSRNLFFLGQALSLAGRYAAAERFLQKARRLAPGDVMITLFLAANSLRAGDETGTKRYVSFLTTQFTVQALETGLAQLRQNPLSPPGSYEDLGQAVFKALIRIAAGMDATVTPKS